MHRLNQIIIMLSKFIKHYDDYSILTKCNSNSSGCQSSPQFEKMTTKEKFNNSTNTYSVKCGADSGLTQVYCENSV